MTMTGDTQNLLEPTVVQFLQEKRFAVLATVNPDGTPQQTVVWYELRGGRLIMNTRKGRLKERNLRRNPLVSFCVEDGYRYVVFRGEVEFDDDPQRAQADMKAITIRYRGQEEGAREWEEKYSKQERVTFTLPIREGYLYGF